METTRNRMMQKHFYTAPFRKLQRSIALLVIFASSASFFTPSDPLDRENFVAFIADPKQHDVTMHWKKSDGTLISSLKNLSDDALKRNSTLLFAMNGGMYHANRNPVGLYIEKHNTLAALNQSKGEGNFFLQPNGVFYITDTKQAAVCTTPHFQADSAIAYATQSGPMLVIDGKVNSQFQSQSKNTNIRNGIGVMPDGRILMVLSKKEINLYDFASYFLRNGCKNALYLDGRVSRAYCPEQNWKQLDGEFGVMIAVTK